MKTNRTKSLKPVLLGAAIIFSSAFLTACPKKKARETAVQAMNNPAQCPDILAGHFFNADKAKTPTYIEVINDPQEKRLILNFNGHEITPVDGKKHAQHNGANFLASCVDNAIKVEGSNAAGADLTMTIKVAQDGGIQLDKVRPEKFSVHYTKAGPAVSALDKVLDKLKTPPTAEEKKEQKTGIPTPADFNP